jgi:hypothetical protein
MGSIVVSKPSPYRDVDGKRCGVREVDNSHANKLTVHILVAVPQHEREMIWERNQGPALILRERALIPIREPPRATIPLRVAGWFAADGTRCTRKSAPAISTSVAATGNIDASGPVQRRVRKPHPKQLCPRGVR